MLAVAAVVARRHVLIGLAAAAVLTEENLLYSAALMKFIAAFVRCWKVNLPICAFLTAPSLVMLAR